MLCLSHTTGYAVLALGCLADQAQRPRFVRDLAQLAGVPRPYLAQVVNRLARKGILVAKRGYRGGITLARPAATISLLEIVEAVEGKAWVGPCLLGINPCSNPALCPTHQFWQDICQRIETKLRQTSLEEMMRCRQRLKASRSVPRTRSKAA